MKELASEGNSSEDISAALGFCRATLFNRKDIRKAYEEGRAEMRVNLRHWQMNAAKSGNVQMLIWLGRNYLQQSETVEVRKPDDDPLNQLLARLNSEANQAAEGNTSNFE